MKILSIFDYIYLIAGVFGTYIIYRFMGIFFENKEVDRKREIISYLSYYIITSTAYLVLNIPILTMTLNLFLLFVISLNYKSTMRKKIISVFLIYTILAIVELIVVLISGYLEFSLFTRNTVDDSIMGHIAIKIVAFIVVLLMENHINIKKRMALPLIYHISVLFIPLGSLYIMLLLLPKRGNIDSYLIVLGIAILFLLNINIFYLYDRLNKRFEEKLETLSLEGQNKYYKNQLETMRNYKQDIQVLRQERKRNIKALKSYISKGEDVKALEYIGQIDREKLEKSEISSSGNMDIDSILNYKLRHAMENGIKVSLKNYIPPNINIDSVDIVTILGNAIDKAVKETSKRGYNKSIDIKMRTKKEAVFITINYTYKDKALSNEKGALKHKKAQIDCGIEFKNIEKILKKYNGMIITNCTDDKVNMDMLMYIK